MAKILQRELEALKKDILSLSAMVEERVHKAIKCIDTRDAYDAGQLIKTDYEVDEKEVEIEEECLKIIALHQPVAVDLRFIIAVIKINNELERIADQAVNIAERVKVIAKNNSFNFSFDYKPTGERVKSMLNDSLDAFVNLDTDAAFKVCLKDDEVDKVISHVYDLVKQEMCLHSDHVGYLINYLLISRHLERIADHATNIAEEVVYLTEGEIVRHGKYL